MTAGQWIGLGVVVLLWSAGATWIVHRKSRRIAELDRQLARALGIITEKNDALRECLDANEQLHARNERLHRDMAAMRERLPRLETDFPPPDDAHRTAEPKLTLAAIRRIVERWPFAPDDVDPDLTRPYIPTYEAGKDEER